MRVTHVIRSLDPRTGGPPTVVLGLARAQADLGLEVRLVYDDPAFSSEKIDLSSLEKRGRVQVENIAESSGSFPSLLAESDFLHLHGLWCTLVRRVAHRAGKAGRPYAIAPHGTLGSWSLGQKRWKKLLALTVVYRKLLDRASFVHVNSRHEAIATKEVVPRSMIEELPHGLDPGEIANLPAASCFFERFPELGDKRFVLFLSRMAHQKAPELLAAAFGQIAEHHRDVHLVFAGPDSGAETATRSQVASLPEEVSKRVHWIGPLFDRDKYAAFRACTVFCLPSRYESFGMVLLEAMAAGAPVVLSDTCHFPEIVETGAGLESQLTIDDLARTLDRALSDEKFLAESGSRGRQLVEAKYLWPGIAARSVELYERHISANATYPR